MERWPFRFIRTNGVTLRTVVVGSGPLVILLHGFPQCWYLWRNQINPLVEAGFQVAVPDQRGYGGSDSPAAVEDFDVTQLTDDIIGLAHALGYEKFHLISHDFGAIVSWHLALLHPERIEALCAMSVPWPFPPPSRYRPGAMTQQKYFGDNFWYITYFQQPGIAEQELDADPRRSIRLVHINASADRPTPETIVKKTPASKLLDGLGDLDELPHWLTAADLDYYEQQYRHSGFRGPINWYRNIDRNITRYPELKDSVIQVPTLFMMGTEDHVRMFEDGWVEGLEHRFNDFHGTVWVEGAGHWLQVEKPDVVNRTMLEFLRNTQ